MANNISNKYNGLAFIKSTDVKVFPCAYRGYYYTDQSAIDFTQIFDPEARGFTEHNYSNIYSKLSDNKHSYIISWDATSGTLKCVIYGYYFELSNMATSDFIGEDGLKKLIILLKEFDLGAISEGHHYKTAILNTLYPDTIDYLDITLPGDTNFYFVGLALADPGYNSGGYTASLTPFKMLDGEIVVDWSQRRVTDTIDNGTGISSIKMTGNVSGTIKDTCAASGDYSAAFGRLTQATGKHSFALGQNTIASGDSAIAIGNGCESKHANAIATGLNTATSAANQIVIGKYNADDADALVIISDKGTEENRANNVTIHKNGDIWTTGSISVEGGRIKATTKTTNTLQLGDTGSANSGSIEVYGTGDDKVFSVTNTGETYIEEKTTINNYVKINNKTYNTSAILPGLVVQGQIKAEKGLDNTLTLGSTDSGDFGALNIYGTEDSTVFTVSNTGEVRAASTLTVDNDTELKKKLTVGGNTSLNGTLVVKDGKNTTLGKDLTVKGDTALKGTLTTDGAAILKSTLGVTSNTTIGGTLTVSSNTDLNGALAVTGASTLTGAITAKNKITGEGDLEITGATTLKSTLEVTNKATLSGDLQVDGSTQLNNNLTVATGKTTTLNGDLTVAGATKVTNTLTVYGNYATTLGGGLSVAGAASFESNITAAGTLGVSGALTVSSISGSGNWTTSGTMTAASYDASSDKRLKENIKEFEYKKSILDLPIYKFDFITGPKNQIGCLAQDLQELYPELVNESSTGFLSIQENKLVYLLIEEVKKLKKEIEKIREN